MITITNKTDCGGCGACASRCVTSCITMAPDEEGFNYPLVDTDKCIHCGLCERVCPLLHKPQPHEILAVIGCKNKNEAVRFVSSSGGFFGIHAQRKPHGGCCREKRDRLRLLERKIVAKETHPGSLSLSITAFSEPL